MSDEVDQILDREEAILEKQIKAARAPVVFGLGSETCVDCDKEIPAARRKAAPFAKRCIDCQEGFESGTPLLKGTRT